MAQQSANMLANSLLSLLLIRILSQADYGLYAYAISLVSFGLAIMTAGLSALAVKALVDSPADQSSTITTLVMIREGAAGVGYLVIVAVSFTSGRHDTIAAVALSGLALFARAADAPEMWYTASVRLGPPARARILIAVLLLAVRVVAVLEGASIWVVLGLFAVEPLLGSLIIMYRFLRDPSSPGLAKPKPATAVRLVRQSWPLMISSMANQANLRSDVVLIQIMVGVSGVAVYSAATRISELAYFLPVVFMNATFPVLLEVRARFGPGSPEYRNFVQRAYTRAFWMGVALACSIGVASYWLVVPLFGQDYEGAVDVLLIQLAACPFIFMSAVFSKWIVAESKLWQSVVRHGTGAVINIGLNVILLPILGIRGAAISTLVSYIVASYLSCFIGKSTRPAARQMTRAMIAPVAYAFNRRS